MSATTSRLLRIAAERYRRGHYDAAIDALCSLLGDEPDSAEAHALLAHSLLQCNRLHAAELEAHRALALDPEGLQPLLACGAVALALRQTRAADEFLQDARARYPFSDEVVDQLARLAIVNGDDARAEQLNAQARELDPESVDHVALAAWLALRRGDCMQVRTLALDALRVDACHVEALCVLGSVHLARGELDDARDVAASVLRVDPMNREGLALLAGIKARTSVLLGLWWRFQGFVAAGSRTRGITILLTIFLVYRIAAITLETNGLAHLATPLSALWLAFCAYTWIAPGLFWKSVRRELAQVRLRPDF